MAVSAPSRSSPRARLVVTILAVALAVAGPSVAAQSDEQEEEGGALASFLAELVAPDESFAPVELALADGLPRSDMFQGIELSVDRARVTNTHPFTMFGAPRPGELFYVVLHHRAQPHADRV